MLPILAIAGGLFKPVSAQVVGGVDISRLPICAQTCLAGNTGAAEGCSISDPGCLCESTPFIEALNCCYSENCSDAEQRTGLQFNILLCDQFNVTIPNFLGCSPDTTSRRPQSFRPVTDQTGTFITVEGTLQAVTTISTVTNVQPALTLVTGEAVAAFNPRTLLNSECGVPEIATTTIDGGAIQAFPWVGCSNDNLGCCAWEDINSAGPLSICPLDYYTTSSACCPTGWRIHTSAIAGQTPCVSSLSVPIVAATEAEFSERNSPAPSIISDQVFTVRYLLESPSPPLSGGAIGGAVVGSLVGASLIGLAIWFCLRRRGQKAQAIRDATVTRSVTETATEFSPVSPSTKISYTLPGSPQTIRSPYHEQHTTEWPNTPPLAQRADKSVAAEMPGSTYIYEHHPAFVGEAIEAPEIVRKPLASPSGVTSVGNTGEVYRS